MNVKISVIGTQKDIYGDENKMEFTVDGTYHEKNGKFYLTYEESEETGFSEGSTTLKMDGAEVTMLRHGPTPSRLTFKEGEKWPGSYVMPFGVIVMETVTSSLEYTKEKLEIIYSLEMDGEKASDNTLRVTWKESERN